MNNNNNTCPICIEDILEDECITKCNHKFHNKCIDKWLENKISCPMCRAQLKEPDKIDPEVAEMFEYFPDISNIVREELDRNGTEYTLVNITIEVRRFFSVRRHLLNMETARILRTQSGRLRLRTQSGRFRF